MSENVQLRLENPKKTHFAGISLAKSLYGPVTILLKGELGAGKTVFLQGLAKGLGITQHITSPTYALEQRYQTEGFGEFLHIDLYRLESRQADELIAGTDDHKGIRCIEWADRLTQTPDGPSITILMKETDEDTVREAEITFDDITLPSEEQTQEWRNIFMLLEKIVQHCDTVGDFAAKLADTFIKQGTIARPLALKRAGQLHDLFRFMDFHRGSAHLNMDITDEHMECWKPWQEKYEGKSHEQAVAAFLREQGYDAIATIIEPHGLRLPKPEHVTIEQKLLFYADKRVKFDEIVTIEERFEDFKNRYSNGKETEKSKIWYEECKHLEKELFPNKPPF